MGIRCIGAVAFLAISNLGCGSSADSPPGGSAGSIASGGGAGTAGQGGWAGQGNGDPCQPGSVAPCTCLGGGDGEMLCAPNGQYFACACTGSGGAGNSGGSGGSGNSGGSGGSGNSGGSSCGDLNGDGNAKSPPNWGTTAVNIDLSAFSALKCDTACCFTGTSDPLAKQAYDDFFAARGFPKTEAELFNQTTPLPASDVDKMRFQMLPAGTPDLHQYYSFLPQITAGGTLYKRHSMTKNSDLFGTFCDLLDPWRYFNPYDDTPAVATHYSRSDYSDVMARQFIFRLKCDPAYKTALEACPDCVDAITALSKDDIRRVLIVRVARPNSAGTDFELGKELKVISTDSSGALSSHAQEPISLFGKLGGTTYRAIWRVEISGKLAQLAGHYGGPTPIMVRAAF